MFAGRLAPAVCALLLLCLARPATAEDYGPLLAMLPESTNAVLLINAAELFDSPYGQEHDWRRKYASRFDASPSMLPPTTERFVWGSEMRLNTLSPTTQYAAMHLSRDLSMPQLARWLKAKLGTVEGLESVETRRGSMVLKFSESKYAVVTPADRQKAARWVGDLDGQTGSRLSGYLEMVVSDPERTTASPVCMAIDLTDALDPAVVRQAMSKSAVVAEAGLDVDQVAELLASIRGVSVLANVTDNIEGRLLLDFGQETAALQDAGGRLITEILSEAGASIAGIEKWQAVAKGKQLELTGALGESGLSRLLSFVEMDTSVVQQPPAQTTTDAPQADAEAEAEAEQDRYANDPATITQEYYASVEKYLRDLSLERGAKSYYSIAVWYDKYAKRIARLPILNVDPDMLDYSESVIGHLRAAADSIQNGGVRTSARGAQITADHSGGYNLDYGSSGYGYPVFSGGANYAASQAADIEAQRRSIRAEEKAQSTLDAKGHLAAIEDESLKIRRKMTEKYGIEF